MGTITQTSVTVGSSTTEILASATYKRRYIRITNISDESVYIKFGTAAVQDEGVAIPAGTTFELKDREGITALAINGICTSGSKDVTVFAI